MQQRMADLRKEEKNIQPVLELLAFLQGKCASRKTISLLLSTWESYLSFPNIHLDCWDHAQADNAQYINIKHTVCGDEEREIFFSIEGIKLLRLAGRLRTHSENLSTIQNILHCATATLREHHRGNDILLGGDEPYPPIAVFLPAGDCTLELVDGNHRVRLAKQSGTDLSVFLIDNYVLPPEAFLGKKSWATYSILSGVYYLQHPMCTEERTGIYFAELGNELERLLRAY